MEPKPQVPRVEDILEPTLLHAINTANAEGMIMSIHTATLEHSPTGEWLEAVGTRLQLRDFFVVQKGELTSLSSGETPLGNRIDEYLQGLDVGVNDIKHPTVIDNGGHVSPEEARRTASIARVAREVQVRTPKSAAKLLSYFSEQEVDSMMSVARLEYELDNIRNGVVERLWSVVQTTLEGDRQTAQQELLQQTEAVNELLDNALLSVLKWRN